MFNLPVRNYYRKEIAISNVKIGKKPIQLWYEVINQKKDDDKKENLKLLCPVLDEHEDEMMQNIATYMGDYAIDVIPPVKGSYSSICRQIRFDAIQVFERLGLGLPDQAFAIKAFRDLRVADAIINKGMDYGFMKLRSLGFNHWHFFGNNMFKDEIMAALLARAQAQQKIGSSVAPII
jgi:hypothetical protein